MNRIENMTMATAAIIAALILCGCATKPRPVVMAYGESDFIYCRLGLIWGPADITGKFGQDDFLTAGESGRSSKRGGGRGSCSSGKCSD